jgi:hypothetical protein
VEFAMILFVLLLLVFAVMELARAMYLYNTLQEATRRAASAAAKVSFKDEPKKAEVRWQAIFRDTSGPLTMGDPITDSHLRIDYLALVRNGDGSLTRTPIPDASLPSCPARNRVICMKDPNDASCVRFVRVRICDPGDTATCKQVPYKTLLPLVDLPINLPKATKIVAADTLGFSPGAIPCP